jgi:uncharacterized protein YndB with AHSA1/START domain
MPTTLEITITVDVPPETVFAAATDLDHFGEWMLNFVSVEKLTDGEFGVGTEFREIRRMFGKEAAEHFEVARYEPPSHLELYVDGTKGSSKKGEYRFMHTFEPIDGGRGTKMTLAGTIDGMGCMGAVFGVLFKGMFVKAIRKDLLAFKAYVEKQA